MYIYISVCICVNVYVGMCKDMVLYVLVDVYGCVFLFVYMCVWCVFKCVQVVRISMCVSSYLLLPLRLCMCM